MIICEKGKEILNEIVVTTLPDERSYALYLGEIGWESENVAYLCSKSGEKYSIYV